MYDRPYSGSSSPQVHLCSAFIENDTVRIFSKIKNFIYVPCYKKSPEEFYMKFIQYRKISTIDTDINWLVTVLKDTVRWKLTGGLNLYQTIDVCLLFSLKFFKFKKTATFQFNKTVFTVQLHKISFDGSK
jgi:hypothetical protein